MKQKENVPQSTEEVARETTTEFSTTALQENSQTAEEKPETVSKKKHRFSKKGKHARASAVVVDPVQDELIRLFEAEREEEPVEEQSVLIAEEATEELSDTQEIPTAVSEPKTILPEIEKTQVVELAGGEEDEVAESSTQLLLEGFEEESAIRVTDEESGEEQLRRVRQEKIEDFSKRREQHMQQDSEEGKPVEDQPTERGEVVYPETPLTTDEKVVEEDEEFTSHEKLGAVRQKLQRMLRTNGLSLFVTVVMELILFFITFFSSLTPVISMNPAVYLIIHLVLFAVLLCVNIPLLHDGLFGLFCKKPTVQGYVSLAAFLTLAHTAMLALNTTGVADGSTPMLTAVSGFSILLLLIAKRFELDRVCRNFVLVAANQGEKLAVKCIDDPSKAEEIGRPAVALGEPRVAFFRKTEFLNSYLSASSDDVLCSSMLKWYLPCVTGTSLLIALIYLLINGFTSWIFSLALFCSIFVATAPVLVIAALQASLARTSHHLQRDNTAICGYQAVKEFGSLHAVAIDAMDIFPEQSVLLHGIKTFSGTRIDDAILDAASVSIRAGGPLSHIFRRMIQNKTDMLHEVDTLVYEQDMGLSGWVNGRRVLIGNRKLLDNHGIDIPSRDYEERYTKNGRQLVYLSIAGDLSAMFVVSYTADPGIKEVLTGLVNRKLTLLIRTCDQNITEELLTSVFELNGFYVELLNAPAGRTYEGLIAGTTETEPAGIASAGTVRGLLRALTACSRLKTATWFYTLLQGLVGATVLGAGAYMALSLGIVFPPLYAIELLAASAVIMWAFSAFFSRK